jgi:hypothetical protein
MTKTKAIKMFKEYARYIIEPKFASEIVKGLGYTLKGLGLKSYPAKSFQRCGVYPEFANSPSIAVIDIAVAIQKEKGLLVTYPYHGMGSNCDYQVEQAIKVL